MFSFLLHSSSLLVCMCVYAKCSDACMLGNVLLASVHCSVSFYNDKIWQANALDSNVFNTEATQWVKVDQMRSKIIQVFSSYE